MPDFIRVPLPAARITTAIGVSVISGNRFEEATKIERETATSG